MNSTFRAAVGGTARSESGDGVGAGIVVSWRNVGVPRLRGAAGASRVCGMESREDRCSRRRAADETVTVSATMPMADQVASGTATGTRRDTHSDTSAATASWLS
ncbi:hypothetical protein ACFPM0_13165 [Pseudonocardia sulfidoxydans]|uniref:hypothetical protein n=1 Tax=Pseudonocardia sulfidoxydans TaxID=54011 RepID=UPI0036067430